MTHKFHVGEHEGYIVVGLFDKNRRPGEIFLVMAKEGSTIRGLMDAFATSISINLQYGVPLDYLVRKFSGSSFEPSGLTGNPKIRSVTSVLDYVFRWLGQEFCGSSEQGTVVNGQVCPECGRMLRMAEGCESCEGCGYSRC